MKTHRLEKTKDRHLFRVVDREGDWRNYFHKPTKLYLRGITHTLGVGFPKTEAFYKYLLGTTKEEAKKLLIETGERGDRVHKAISNIISGNGYVERDELIVPSRQAKGLLGLEDDEWECVLAFGRFWNDHEPVVFGNEFPTYNLKAGMAGTCDIAWILTKKCKIESCRCDRYIGKLGLCDVKTGRGPFDWWVAQLAAYRQGENLGEVKRKRQIEYAMNLRIGTKSASGWQATFYTSGDLDVGGTLFWSAQKMCDKIVGSFDESKIVTIPDRIILTMKKEKDLVPAKKKKKPIKKSKRSARRKRGAR